MPKRICPYSIYFFSNKSLNFLILRIVIFQKIFHIVFIVYERGAMIYRMSQWQYPAKRWIWVPNIVTVESTSHPKSCIKFTPICKKIDVLEKQLINLVLQKNYRQQGRMSTSFIGIFFLAICFVSNPFLYGSEGLSFWHLVNIFEFIVEMGNGTICCVFNCLFANKLFLATPVQYQLVQTLIHVLLFSVKEFLK